MSEERLQKILARAGLGSRRACEQIITDGRVTVNGRIVTELGVKVDPTAVHLCVDGQQIRSERQRYVMLHKPAGYLSGPDRRAGYPSWVDLVRVPERLFAVGRLDRDSEGLLLLTNDGELAQRLTHPRHEHPKTYLVQVQGVPNPRKIRRLQHGVMLDDGPTAPAEVELLRKPPAEFGFQQSVVHGSATRDVSLGPGSPEPRTGEPGQPSGLRDLGTGGRPSQRTSWLRVTLREGRKRQLRRMVGLLGHPALRVVRIGLGPLALANLPSGKWRDLTSGEVRALREAAWSGAAPDEAPGARPASPSVALRPGRKALARQTQSKKETTPLIPDIIAIDGPAASGKSTIGRLLAKELGYLYFDTGVMYRAVAALALARKVQIADEAAVTALAEHVELEVLPPTVADGRDVTVLADGQDITWDIRQPEVEHAVSPVSAYLGVRRVMRFQQRRIGLGGRVVMVGRDIGTVVLPEADLKIYLDASLKERAHRRYLERHARGEAPSFEQVLVDIKRRDEIDSTREYAPLTAAPDAIVVDTTELSVDQVMVLVRSLVGKWAQQRQIAR